MREDLKKILTIGGGLAFLVVLVSFGLYQGRNLIFGSHLTVTPIQNSTADSILNLSGVGEHAKEVTINGRTALMDASGTFSESVALLPGLNVITVSSTNSFGKTKSETLYTYHTATSRTAVNLPPPPESSEITSIIN